MSSSAPAMAHPRAWSARDTRKTVIVVSLVLVAIFAVSFWPTKSAPAYEYGKLYSFQYSLLSTATTADGRTVASRLFIFERDGLTFSSPVESYGRPITVRNGTLLPNTFRIVRRVVPPLAIGERVFDPGVEFDQVHFNMRHVERQAVVPRVTPRNTPPASGKR